MSSNQQVARPLWSKAIKPGDVLTIRSEYMGRGGQSGEVLSIHEDGVGLDFFCDRSGDPRGVPSQEFWEWGEIDDEILPASIEEPSHAG